MKDTLKADLFAAVSIALKEHGFLLKASKDTFLREHSCVVDMFPLVCLDGKPGLRIQPNVAVRIERVEDLFHQTSGFEARYQKDTPTIGGSIGSILGKDNRGYEFFLEDPTQVPEVAKQIIDGFHSIAIPYFHRFDQLAAIDAELNAEPEERTPNRVAPWLRASSGIIVAKLLGRPNYEELVDVYTNTLRHSDKGFYLKRFQNLVQSLNSV